MDMLRLCVGEQGLGAQQKYHALEGIPTLDGVEKSMSDRQENPPETHVVSPVVDELLEGWVYEPDGCLRRFPHCLQSQEQQASKSTISRATSNGSRVERWKLLRRTQAGVGQIHMTSPKQIEAIYKHAHPHAISYA